MSTHKEPGTILDLRKSFHSSSLWNTACVSWGLYIVIHHPVVWLASALHWKVKKKSPHRSYLLLIPIHFISYYLWYTINTRVLNYVDRIASYHVYYTFPFRIRTS